MSTPAGPAEELLAVLTGIRRVLRRRRRDRLSGPPLRGAQLELLQLVEAEPGIGVAAAARALYLAGNSVSTLVNQLVEDGLLRRTPDPADRRAVRLDLAPAARERLGEGRALRLALAAGAFDRLPQPDREAVTAALPALRRLLHELDSTGSEDP